MTLSANGTPALAPGNDPASQTRNTRYAVIDGPRSTQLLVLPPDRHPALEIKRVYGRRSDEVGGFYCPMFLGGCGGELNIAAGEVYTPHFRHRSKPHATAPCQSSDFERSQDHAYVQQLLRTHFECLGYRVTLEYRHKNATRSDVLITAGNLANTALGLEVQLSPQTRERTEARHASVLRRKFLG